MFTQKNDLSYTKIKFMKSLIFTFISFLALALSFSNSAEQQTKNSAVVLQLFTSQGCSSCPSADDFLETIKKEYATENVFVLSYHVDYWNSLGWKDPFSKAEYTNLQYKYGRKFNSNRVYTPQLIVNGKKHFVGSSKRKITQSIADNLKLESTNGLLFSNITKELNTISFDYKITGKVTSKKLQIALVLDNEITKVKRGENTNRTISNSNIVIHTLSKSITDLSGNITLKVPKNYKNKEDLSIIGFIENGRLQISGATQIKV